MIKTGRNGYWVFLSYPWGASCPGYAGAPSPVLERDKGLLCGDSCNTMRLSGSNHSGTHFDFPLHFDRNGLDVTSYDAGVFCHDNIAVVRLCGVRPGELITPERFAAVVGEAASSATMLIIDTGFGRLRADEEYWRQGPGLGPGLAAFIRTYFPRLTTLGVDLISISSLQHRDIGRIVHREFLCATRPILLIEDMDLTHILNAQPTAVVALPIRLEGADGAPCTIIAYIETEAAS